MKDNNVQREPVSRVGAVLFILTMLVIIALIALPVTLLFSLDDIVREALNMVQSFTAGVSETISSGVSEIAENLNTALPL